MKRHPSLVPLSHDHHHGLVQARRLRLAAERDPGARTRAAEDFAAAWRGQIAPHLDREERRLLPYVTPEAHAARLVTDHAALRDLARAVSDPETVTAERCRELAARLESHIRWEERELFPSLERTLDESTLLMIGAALDERGT